jgi:hypothetical protein
MKGIIVIKLKTYDLATMLKVLENYLNGHLEAHPEDDYSLAIANRPDEPAFEIVPFEKEEEKPK